VSITQNRRAKLIVAAASITSLALALSACSNSLSQSTPSASTSVSIKADPTLTAMLPESIKSAGVIQVGVDATYKPNEYLNGTQVVGWDVELFDAVAAKLGVKTNWNVADFNSVKSGTTSGKYNIGVSSFTISADRLNTFTMVSYANVGSEWATLTGNPKAVDRLNPCGKTIAVQTGTVQDDEIAATNKSLCASKPVIVLSYTGQDEVNNAVAIGKADAMLADYPVTQSAIAASGGKMAVLGEVYGAAPYGYIVTKDNQALAEATAAALAQLKSDGTYDAILAKYGIQGATIATFEVNPKV
jgi:polar amino acid transport system substrate-binding protein